MKRIGLILPLVFMLGGITGFQQANEKVVIPAGYYYGHDRLFTIVFLKMEEQRAVVDLVFYQKYPRELVTDTLRYNTGDQTWQGKSVTLFQKKGNYYVATEEGLPVFGKRTIRIAPDEARYKKYHDEYKNRAVWHACYREYVDSKGNSVAAQKKFHELEAGYKLNTLAGNLSHDAFLKELAKLKAEL